ncbi:hypothetical protein D3C80_1942630 [compost metagenome]
MCLACSSAPAFLDINAEEQAKHMKHASAGSKEATPAGLPGGREQRTSPPEAVAH